MCWKRKRLGKYIHWTEIRHSLRCYIKNFVIYTERMPSIVRAVKFRML